LASTAPGHLLITSAARKVPLIRAAQDAARRLDGAIQVIAADANPNALARYFADDFWAMPSIDAVPVDTILAECLERGVATILPTRDGELPYWAEHRDRFAEAGIHVVVSGPEAVRTCLDKLAFHDWCQGAGFPAIATAAELAAIPAERLVVKERTGAGSREIGLDLTRAAAAAHAEGLEDPIFQPFISGREISVDLYSARDGRVVGAVPRRRDLVINGESQVTTTFRDPALETLATDLAGRLGLHGPAVMQVLIDETGAPWVIELNTRFGGASTCGIAAGLDALSWALSESRGAPPGSLIFRRAETEIRQVRAPADRVFPAPDGSLWQARPSPAPKT